MASSLLRRYPVFTAYGIWGLFLLVHSAWRLYIAPQQIGNVALGPWLALYGITAVLLFAAGAILAWLTDRGKKVARVIFVVYCLFSAVNALWGGYHISIARPTTLTYASWGRALAFAVVWIALAVFAWQRRYAIRRSNPCGH